MDLTQDTLTQLKNYRKHVQKNVEQMLLAAKRINVTMRIQRITKKNKYKEQTYKLIILKNIFIYWFLFHT